jgi:hypothetical protein
MVLPVVSGVGGAETAAAEAAILLLDLCAGLEDPIASAAFLFFGWEGMVSTVEEVPEMDGVVGWRRDSRHTRLWG